ncbi:MAG: phosphonoacetaldehyde hydrolase [Clostridiales Family XIII bacterium]|jgi:phosphonoacetaldehyde hydrolase|nr:phosphonoacetaldehyde hydrolase [Clostridiales Family XIII bacterium]
MKNIKTVILDWAGTAVDFGSFAPVRAFIEAFESFGVTPTTDETRAPMGMQKRAHIESMLSGERLSALWRDAYGRAPAETDADNIYACFEPALFSVLKDHAAPLPGLLETVARIRDMGVKIGSTTGYTAAMMEIVTARAFAAGYEPDCLVCPDEVGGVGRPYPYMLWRNLEKMGILSINSALKVGDTAADMHEGKNAGCLCVGVIEGSNMLGLRENELRALNGDERRGAFEDVRRRYAEAGADFVIEDISALPDLIESLDA